jgi:hypothetical protein
VTPSLQQKATGRVACGIRPTWTQTPRFGSPIGEPSESIFILKDAYSHTRWKKPVPVDVCRYKYRQELIAWNMFLTAPPKQVQILGAFLNPLQNQGEQLRHFLKPRRQNPEALGIELVKKGFTTQMLHESTAVEGAPVIVYPASFCVNTEVAAGLFTLDPFVVLDGPVSLFVNSEMWHCLTPQNQEI